MSENKCPFCGEAMITTEDKIMLCENSDCATMFNEWDYPKVAAAMELAKKLVLLSMTDINPDHYEIEKQVEKAERRVIEVFGK